MGTIHWTTEMVVATGIAVFVCALGAFLLLITRPVERCTMEGCKRRATHESLVRNGAVPIVELRCREHGEMARSS